MAISFDEISAGLRVPGTYMETDPSNAEVGAGSFPLKTLILAPGNTTGDSGWTSTIAVNTPTAITSWDQAKQYAGKGSIAARMAKAWFSTNNQTEVHLCIVADDGSAVKHKRSITFGGTQGVGNVALYIAGFRFSISNNQTRAQMVTALQTAVTALADSDPPPFKLDTTGASTGQIFVEARNGGPEGEQLLDIRVSHLDGEVLPDGATVTIANETTGATAASITSAVAAISGVQYDLIVHPFTDATNLSALETELATRADAMTAIPGLAITGKRGTQGELTTLGNGRNSEYSSIVGFESFPGAAYERAAAVAGLVARYGSSDPARPFQNLDLPGYAPALSDRFTIAERNILLADGISTTRTDRTGTQATERMITTNQTNAAGSPTTAFLDVNTILLLAYFRKAYTARMSSRFARSKLAADGGTPPAAGSRLVTPKTFLGEAVALYIELERLGLVEDVDGFVANSTVEINSSDPTRIDASLAPNFVNGLRVSATLLQFRL